jgi:RimJ/RimL family protein N-acetyltransferase
MNEFVRVSDEVLTLRPFNFGEENVLHQAVQESMAELNPWMSWATDGYTLEVARKFIALTRANWSASAFYAFGIFDSKNGTFLGGCSLSHIHPIYHFGNLGYWVRTSQRGRGIAGHAARLTARFGFERLNLLRAEIVVAEGNNASIRVAKKIGAHDEGLLKNRMVIRERVCDAHMFSLVPTDFGMDHTLIHARHSN